MNAYRRFALLGIWLLIFIGFSIALPGTFATLNNLETLIRQTVIVGAAGIGMTFIIIAGDIDLSVGSLVALVSVVIAWSLQHGAPPLAAAAIGVLSGCAAGALNGFLVSYLRISSFIVTLATMLAFRGFAKSIADEKKIDAPMTFLNQLTAAVPHDQGWRLLPTGGWIVILLAALSTWMVNSTVFGRHVVATGSNAQTAILCGVRTDRLRVGVFLLGGLMFGIAGLMQFSRLTVGDPTTAVGLELNVIAAVVIGGASLSGGEGSIMGTLLGALIMTTISAGGGQLGWPNYSQEIITGVIILGAVALDRRRARGRS